MNSAVILNWVAIRINNLSFENELKGNMMLYFCAFITIGIFEYSHWFVLEYTVVMLALPFYPPYISQHDHYKYKRRSFHHKRFTKYGSADILPLRHFNGGNTGQLSTDNIIASLLCLLIFDMRRISGGGCLLFLIESRRITLGLRYK